MKVFVLLHVIFVVSQFQITRTQRRIVKGNPVDGEVRRYMAYLIRAPDNVPNTPRYDAWICGGALVSSRAIVTSAACIEDVQHMYAIAGYRNYVQTAQSKTDECTKSKDVRKKVIYSCIPVPHNFDYEKIENWTNSDIGVVMVESAFDFAAKEPSPGCSWVPSMIPVNYIAKFQSPNTDAIVMGFGHQEKWRQESEKNDLNVHNLQYAAVRIMDKNKCKESYKSYEKLVNIIEKYMICTMGEGSLDSQGNTIKPSTFDKDDCDENNDWDIKKDFTRQGAATIVEQTPGICQNDHGGPLITWIGPTPHLIGVASVFLVDAEDRSCNGPYLYTSTACNRVFLNCVLSYIRKREMEPCRSSNYRCRGGDADFNRRQQILRKYDEWYEKNKHLCDLPPEQKGFDIRARRISWINHVDGPAADELGEDLIERPQISLNVLRNLKGPSRFPSNT